MHTWACPGRIEWTSSGWFNGTWTSSLWQGSCVTSCISFLERPPWKKQLYEWCKMTSRREQHDCLKGFWEGLDQRIWIRMTRCTTWWKPAYAFLHLWSIYVTLDANNVRVLLLRDRWRNVGVVKVTMSCFWLFFFYISCYIDWEYRCGEYMHATTLDRITVSNRVSRVWCLSCHTSWQDKRHHCK